MTTLQKLVADIAADIDREEAAIKMHNIVARALARFEGKPLTKRITTYVLEQLPKGAFVNYDGGCVKIWGVPASEGYEQRSTHYLPPAHACLSLGGDQFNRVKAFHENSDACNGEAAIRRNAERVQLMKDPDHLTVLAKAIDAHNLAFRHVYALTDDGIIGHPAHYSARRLLEGTEDHKRAEDEAREARRNKR